MNQNFAILGMFDRNSIMSVVNKQPSSYKFIVAVVNSEAKAAEGFKGEDVKSEEKELLNNLGIRCNLLGYNYILDALKMIRENPDSLRNITKELYPELAQIYKTQPCNIERAIRHAIEHAWNIGNIDLKNKIFGYTVSPEKGRPTNGEFLAALAHYLEY
ncbi:MAG: sporulation initiation factor Spo0A C-terminal domain-containing protein [Lachnospiraceae bacterium]|nr:sporulation initiation factor Spo0A C-terminal domain-containing protein [Lachnospiraceae bacterium]MDD3796484.1 sporulation initiation factor Spo0A C-terminal domain-containing protein [Lachnospiraceae bacterium]